MFWNVQGLRKKSDEIRKYLEKYNVIALSETWVEEKQMERIERNLPSNYNWKWITAVREKVKGRPAGGLVIGTRKGVEAIEWKGNSRGCWAGLKVKVNNRWINIISVYNNTKSKELRKELERELEEALMKGEETILGGDLNARIGKLGALDEEEERSTMDNNIDEEGELWMELFDTYDITVLNGNVNGDLEGNYTRLGYKNQEEAVLDYAGISRKALNSIDSFVIGTEGSSDHFPLEITLTDCTPTALSTKKVQQIWNDATIIRYRMELANAEKGESWEELSGQLWAASTKRTAKETNRNRWWNEECYKARVAMRHALQSMRVGVGDAKGWREAKKKYKTTIKAAKEALRQRWKEELDNVSSISEGWKYIRRHAGASTQGGQPPKEALVDHFRNLLEGSCAEDGYDYVNPINEAAPNASPLTMEEFTIAIRQLKERKAAGPDLLKAESLIFADQSSHENLKSLVEAILKGGEVPAAWCDSTLWPIHKKGDRDNPANYRGIAIGNAIYKLLAVIVGNRLRHFVETHNILPDTQNGFREKRSTVDNIAILNGCVQQCLADEQGKLYALFVDFKTAFDCVDRRLLFRTLRTKGIPDYLVNTVEAMYKRTSYIIEGVKFPSHKGLKQGCPLSPLLFAIFIADMDEALRRNQLGGLVIGDKKVYSLAFADDIVLLALDPSAMKDMIKALHLYEKRKRIEINVPKSKILVFNKGSRKSKVLWKIGERAYEEVEEFPYLGVTFQRNGNFTRHHNAVTRKANRRATEVWSLGERLFPQTFNVRMQMFQTLVKPIILYAAEITGYVEWEKYEVIQRRYARWTLGLPRSSRNAIVAKEAGLYPLSVARLERALRYEPRPHVSPLLRTVQTSPKANSHVWAHKRMARLNELGWNAENFLADLRNVPNLWRQVVARAEDQSTQLNLTALDKIQWYSIPMEPPLYLSMPDFKAIARIRCGAEARGEDSWRTESNCRVCGRGPETMPHLLRCANISLYKLGKGSREDVLKLKSYLAGRPQ